MTTYPSVFRLDDFHPRRRIHGANKWTAERQRTFIAALAETGCVTLAAHEAGVPARSAYRFRAREGSEPFAKAWDDAMLAASRRLVDIAFERAVRGTPRELWRDGELVGESRTPSDRLLTFLLGRLLPDRFAERPPQFLRSDEDVHTAVAGHPANLAALADSDEVADPYFEEVSYEEMIGAAPADADDDDDPDEMETSLLQ